MTSESPIKVYVIGSGLGYARPIKNKVIVPNIEDADVVVLTGGADVCPSVYGKAKHPSTWGSEARDSFEIREYNLIKPDQVVYGVCRGAQLLCALNGGILIQDVDNHALGILHLMKGLPGTDFANVEMPITSLHHQMMYPFDLPKENYTTLFNAYPSRSHYYEGDGVDPAVVAKYGEPEVVIFHTPGKPVGLAVQGHPEMMHEDSKAVVLVNTILRNLLKKNGRL